MTSDTTTRPAAGVSEHPATAGESSGEAPAVAGHRPTVHEALTAVMRDIGAIGKDGFNEKQRFHFRGVDDVMNAIAGPFRSHGVYVVPEVLEATAEARQTKDGGAMNATRLRAAFHFYGPAGDRVTAVTAGEGADMADKSTNKAMAAAFKYALLYALMIPTEATLDEPDASHPEGGMLTAGGLRAVIGDHAKRLGMSRDETARQFAEANGGRFIGDADIPELQAFLEVLAARRPPPAEPPADPEPPAETEADRWDRHVVQRVLDEAAQMPVNQRRQLVNDLLVEAVKDGASGMAKAMLQNALRDAAEAQRKTKQAAEGDSGGR